jgi:TolA-binding protein
LGDLIFLHFSSSGCIGSFEAQTPELIQELKQKLLLQCPPLGVTTSPQMTTTTRLTTNPMTTTISTSTTTQCSVRCSLDFEFDELSAEVAKQNDKIAKLEEINREQEEINHKLEDRLVEVEQLIREIGARS